MFKANEIARWVLLRNKLEQDKDEEVESITHLKLQKLLYYAQGVYLAIADRALFEENILAWKHGPVVEEVYHEYNCYGRSPIPVEYEEHDQQVISVIENDKNAADTLEFVYNEYGKYTAWALRDKTHHERPWEETPRNEVISQRLIKEYFQSEVIEVE